MEENTSSKFANGLLLVTLGIIFFALRHLDDFAELIVFFLVGGIFLFSYFYTRLYGLLIPGSLLIGLGSGLWLQHREEMLPLSYPFLAGLGAGFLLIYVIGILYEHRYDWWPLIPGFILLFFEFFLRLPNLFDYFREYWPFLFIVLGLLLMFSALQQKMRKKDEE